MARKYSVNIKVKIWFFDVHRVMKPVVVAKILQEAWNFSSAHWLHYPMNVKKNQFLILKTTPTNNIYTCRPATFLKPSSFIHRWMLVGHATLHWGDVMGKWTTWVVDVIFDWCTSWRLLFNVMAKHCVRYYNFSSPGILQIKKVTIIAQKRSQTKV